MCEENSAPHEGLIKSWRAVYLFVLTVSVGFYLFVQGAHVSGAAVVAKETTAYTASVYGYLVLIPLCIFFYSYTYHVIKTLGEDLWYASLPIFMDVHLPSGNSFLKKIQIMSLILVFSVPALSLYHCYTKSLDGSVYHNSSCETNEKSKSKTCTKKWPDNADAGALSSFIPFSHMFKREFRNEYRYDGQITYFPGWQPWLALLLIFWALILWVRAFSCVAMKNPVISRVVKSIVKK